MGIDLSNDQTIHNALLPHVGHKIVCVAYCKHGEPYHRSDQIDCQPIVGVSIECETCGEVLVAGSPLPESPSTPDLLFICPAEICSEDQVWSAKFDAEPALRVASDNNIRALIECGFSGYSGADDIALMRENEQPLIQVVLEYCDDSYKRTGRPMGFEVAVDREAALKYLWDRRPSLMREIQAEGNYDVGHPAAVKHLSKDACDCPCHCGGYEGGELVKQPCDDCDCPD